MMLGSHGAEGGYRTARTIGWGDAFGYDKIDKQSRREKAIYIYIYIYIYLRDRYR
jgi:hypothetical protein